MANQRQPIMYGPNGPIYAPRSNDPAFGNPAPPIDYAFGGSPSMVMPAASGWDNPSAYTSDPQAVAANLAAGGPGIPNAPGYVPPAGMGPVDPAQVAAAANNTGNGMTGNALGINPTMNDTYATNTDALAFRYTANAGQGMNSGSLGLNQDYANNLPYVYLLLHGNNAMNPANAPGSAAYFDWSKNYMDQGNSPNGSAISPQQVMAALFTKDVKNPIYQFVYKNGTAKPDEIVNNFVSLMQAGMEHQVPPFVLQAMTGMYKQYGAMWIDAKSQGYAGDFTDFLAEQGLSPANLGM